jgi:hypothetical protein
MAAETVVAAAISRTVTRRASTARVITTLAGRFGLAVFKGFLVAAILWRIGLFALESRQSPHLWHISIGAAIAFAVATIYFIIWPSPLGDARDWDEIFHVPPPPRPENDAADAEQTRQR